MASRVGEDALPRKHAAGGGRRNDCGHPPVSTRQPTASLLVTLQSKQLRRRQCLPQASSGSAPWATPRCSIQPSEAVRGDDRFRHAADVRPAIALATE